MLGSNRRVVDREWPVARISFDQSLPDADRYLRIRAFCVYLRSRPVLARARQRTEAPAIAVTAIPVKGIGKTL